MVNVSSMQRICLGDDYSHSLQAGRASQAAYASKLEARLVVAGTMGKSKLKASEYKLRVSLPFYRIGSWPTPSATLCISAMNHHHAQQFKVLPWRRPS